MTTTLCVWCLRIQHFAWFLWPKKKKAFEESRSFPARNAKYIPIRFYSMYLNSIVGIPSILIRYVQLGILPIEISHMCSDILGLGWMYPHRHHLLSLLEFYFYTSLSFFNTHTPHTYAWRMVYENTKKKFFFFLFLTFFFLVFFLFT